MSTWIVIIDDGLTYSDHYHWVALAEREESKARAAAKCFNEWVARFEAEYRRREGACEDCDIWEHEWFPPFWNNKEDKWTDRAYSIIDHSADVICVPEWAEAMP